MPQAVYEYDSGLFYFLCLLRLGIVCSGLSWFIPLTLPSAEADQHCPLLAIFGYCVVAVGGVCRNYAVLEMTVVKARQEVRGRQQAVTAATYMAMLSREVFQRMRQCPTAAWEDIRRDWMAQTIAKKSANDVKSVPSNNS